MTLEVVHTSVMALFIEETFCILYFADVLNLGTIRKEMMAREKVMTRGQMMTSERVSARRDKYFFPVGLNSFQRSSSRTLAGRAMKSGCRKCCKSLILEM